MNATKRYINATSERDHQHLTGRRVECEQLSGDFQERFDDILVPIDLAQPALRSLRIAGRLAEQFGSRVHLLHVEERSPIFNDLDSQIVFAKTDEQVAAEDVEELSRLADHTLPPKVESHPIVRMGRPAREILKAAKRLQCGLIILATRPRSGLARVLLGSTADAVAHHAPCPVLLVVCDQAPATECKPWRHEERQSVAT